MNTIVNSQLTNDRYIESKLREDKYPSRNCSEPAFNPRLDPVVYAHADQHSPIESTLINQYEEQGFLILDDVFSASEVSLFEKELSRLSNDKTIQQLDETITERSSDAVRSIFSVHKLSALFKKLASDKRLISLAEYILNDQVYLHQARVNYKPGFCGKEFFWHSDFETWHVEDGMPNMRALSMSISLTENVDSNGPLMLIPGSHKQFLTCTGTTPENHFKDSLKKQEIGVPDNESLGKLVEQGGIVSATGKPGSVTVFDCNVMHGSNCNITPYPRANVFFVYNAISNRVGEPFCSQPPRPEYICSRQTIEALNAQSSEFVNG